MRLLILAARFPEYSYRGDQLRTRQLLELLAPEHELRLVTGGKPRSPAALREVERLANVTLVDVGPISRALGAVRGLLRGYPAQVGWMAPGRFQREARLAAGHSDAVIAETVRVVTEPLPAPVILDHIDALSANMLQRARLDRHRLRRLATVAEGRMLGRHERRAARWVAAQIAVSELDVPALPTRPRPVVIPQAVIEPVSDDADAPSGLVGRDIDVIFTGNMGYPPNRDAASWLAHEIAAELRRLRPEVRIVVAGRGAGRLALHDVEVQSDVPDLFALLRRARVAIVPLRAGTGVPNKLLEAAAAGAGIVATPGAAAAAGVAALTGETAPALAAAVAHLLEDERARRRLTATARNDLARRAPEAVSERLRDVLRLATSGAARAAS